MGSILPIFARIMHSWNEKVPSYLVGKYQTIATVIFTALFCLAFLVVSVPFARGAWFDMRTLAIFALTVIFFFSGVLVVSLSRRFMYGYAKNNENMKMYQYVLWCLAEILALCVLYATMSYYGARNGILDGEIRFWQKFYASLSYALMGVGVPYLISGMYFNIIDKNNTIRLLNYANVVTDEVEKTLPEKKITLFDNSGVLKMSIDSSNLCYIESDDNYIKVWYLDSRGDLKQYMLRCRLKTVENSFADSDLMRCHRKYIVNMRKVSMLRKEKDGYEIDLDVESIPSIPISKTYEEAILSRFNSFQ